MAIKTEIYSIEEGRKLLAQQGINATSRQNKYNSKRVKAHGFSFDSEKEKKRYEILRFRELAGDIKDLQYHKVYKFIHNDRYITSYEADFVYNENRSAAPGINPAIWQEIVEDCKGMKREKFKAANGKTQWRSNPAYEMFLIKKKMMLAFYNIDVKEI